MLNALTVDVEEYFHAANLGEVAPAKNWHRLESRVEYSTRKVLELFSELGIRGTFFTLGYVARRHRGLIADIIQGGHELASHGYGHQIAYHQTPKAFYRDVRKAKYLLEDISGAPVTGYRAPNFSITAANPWAYAELLRAGYEYDSSCYPVWHPRYANTAMQRNIFTVPVGDENIVIVPLATAELNYFGKAVRIPVAGGAYWRLLPKFFMRWGLRRVALHDRLPAVCYFHPWEVDAGQPRFKQLSHLTKLRHYGGVQSFPKVISQLTRDLPFGTVSEVVRQYRENA